LAGDRGGQHHVVDAHPVRGDHDDVVAVGVELPDLSGMHQFQSVLLPARRGRGQRTRVRGAYDQAMADLEVQYLQVQTTTDSRAEAMELSRAAVESRRAGCAQGAVRVASMYWWAGALERTVPPIHRRHRA